MNVVTDKIKVGTVGELLVQIRLLQFNVQAAPPIKDSGNDLIAVNGTEFRAVSVRTTTTGTFTKPNASRQYHVLAVVHLVGEGRTIDLDKTEIFLVPEPAVSSITANCYNLEQYKFSQSQVESLFGALSI